MVNARAQQALVTLQELENLLDQLEKLHTKRYRLRKEVRDAIKKRRNFYAMLLGLILGLIIAIGAFVLFELYASPDFMIEDFVMVGLALGIFSGVLIGLLFVLLWERGFLTKLHDRASKYVLDQAQAVTAEILQQTREILASSALTETTIPFEYLTPICIDILKSYIQRRQCDTVREAVSLFKMDMENANNRYVRLIKHTDSLVIRSQRFVDSASEEG